MSSGSIYSASDKALFDAINQSAVTAADLRALFLKHGMIISNATPRRQLALHFARLVHDFHDFEALARLFDSPQRRERLSSVRVTTGVSGDAMEAVVQQLITKLAVDSDLATVNRTSSGALELHVRYKKFHFNKSEFRQIENKDALISIEPEGGTYVIRGPHNEKVDQIRSELLMLVEEATGAEIQTEEISLESFRDSSTRTRFFQMLIDHIQGHPQYDVTDVYFFNPNEDARSTEQLLRGISEASSPEDDEPELGIHIDSATLKGGRVLESPEMRDLLAKGFYISKIVWKARASGFDDDILEFEAQFAEPESCTEFSYMVRGYYEYLEKGEFSKHRKQFGTSDERQMGKLIEDAARTVLHKFKKQLEHENAQDKVA